MRRMVAVRLTAGLMFLHCVACSQPEDLRLRYVANEGVLLVSGGRKVLVDALFDRPNPAYYAPSPADRAKMSDESPFDGVDLVLVTHGDSDHFDAALVARYMAAVARPVLIAPADAVAALRRTPEWGRIAPRVIALDLKAGETHRRAIAGIAVTVLRTLHSGDRDSPMNLVYIVEMNGWRVFHEGDAPADTAMCEQFVLGEKPVDLALVSHWRPRLESGARLLRALQPEHVVLMHVGVESREDAARNRDEARRDYADVALLLPGMEEIVLHRDD